VREIETASSVSVSEPIWFTFTRIEFADALVSMPFWRNLVLVTKRSSPTSCDLVAEFLSR
jgi:hypothetical protein